MSFVSAKTLIKVNAYEERELPSLTSNESLDLEGLQRTYLYCTWRIDNAGEEAKLMSANICPRSPTNFTFDDDDDYSVRIDYAKIKFNTTSNKWDTIETGNSGLAEYLFWMQVPEPEASLLTNIYDSILVTIKSWLCPIFPWFCS